MTTPEWPRPARELARELTQRPSTPVLLRGRELSGRSRTVEAVANALQREVIVFEAVTLQGSALPWEEGGTPQALRTRLDEMLAVAATRNGDDVVIVIDHLDPALVSDPQPIIAAAEWMAAQVHVVVIASPQSSRTLPAHWHTIDHATASLGARPSFGGPAGL